jgi:hypothetical protein
MDLNFKEPTVIASEAKQSMAPREERMDCFVARAPRNDGQTQIYDLAAHCARGLQSNVRPSKLKRGQGMPDARCTRGSCAMCTESARMSIQGSGGNPTFPAQWLYGL